MWMMEVDKSWGNSNILKLLVDKGSDGTYSRALRDKRRKYNTE